MVVRRPPSTIIGSRTLLAHQGDRERSGAGVAVAGLETLQDVNPRSGGRQRWSVPALDTPTCTGESRNSPARDGDVDEARRETTTRQSDSSVEDHDDPETHPA